MKLSDSRRLTGPNLLSPLPGAVLDVELAAGEAAPAVAAWRGHAHRLLAAVGWGGETTAVRLFPGGASLFLSAPVDALYAATEVNEWAWAAATADLGAEPAEPLAGAAARLAAAIAAAANPALLALATAARRHGVAFFRDDEQATVGLGAGSRTWPAGALPRPEEVPWGEIHDVPVALVTGTNGKTTSVRLLAAMVEAAGRAPGVSSTDWIRVAGVLVERGDYSGPGGARTVLRDRRVEVALLETARGGMLRRGLVLDRADVALVTNVAADHLGELGVTDVEALAEAKLIVARAARRLVANADDEVLAPRVAALPLPITWFSLDEASPRLPPHLASGGTACFLAGDELVLCQGSTRRALATLREVPITLDGAARHNVANALGAIGVAAALGLPAEAIRAGLTRFDSSPESNPGRLNLFDLGGVTCVVDFAHNPHGLAALLAMTAALPARRRLVVLGQAGDRDDDAIREMARIVWQARPDRVIVKEMTPFLRGRREGEVPALLTAELLAQGAPPAALATAPDELEAARQALAWSRPGDLLLLLSHAQRSELLALLDSLRQAAWKPAQPLPP